MGDINSDSSLSGVVEKFFLIPGGEPNSIRASVLVVKLSGGEIKVNDIVTLKSRYGFPLTVQAIEQNRKFIEKACAGDTVGLLFNNIDLSSVISGDVLLPIER